MRISQWLERHSLVNYWLPVYLYAALIFYFSSIRFGPLPQNLLTQGMDFVDPKRMVLHVIEYSGLGFLLYRAMINSSKKIFYENAFVLAVLFGLFYGITDEIHQALVPTREMSLFDVFSDGLGSMTGTFLSLKKNRK